MRKLAGRIKTIGRRIRGLRRREKIALVTTGVLGTSIVIAAATATQALATALLGLAATLVLLGAIHLHRQNKGLAKRFDAAQRRMLAVVENERLAAADRQQALEMGQRRILAAVENERLAAADRQQALEMGQRSILAAAENERLAVADQQRELLSASARKTVEDIAAGQRRLGDDLAKLQRDQTAEVEALLQLFRGFEPRAPMPSSGRWAMNPKGLLEVLFLIGQKQPKVVLELGSGTSSVWIAYCLEKTGGRLISVDHDTRFADRTRSILGLHGLTHVAEVRLAQLHPLSIDGEDFEWYDEGAFEDVHEVDLLFVDGPPGSIGSAARYPALPVLEDKLASGALVILDDANRPEEKDIVKRWTTTVDGLHRESEIFGRQAVLTFSRP